MSMKKSLIFFFFKCCADMSQRPDIVRGGRESAIGSARREKDAQHPPRRRRQGAFRLVGVMVRKDHRHRRVRWWSD